MNKGFFVRVKEDKVIEDTKDYGLYIEVDNGMHLKYGVINGNVPVRDQQLINASDIINDYIVSENERNFDEDIKNIVSTLLNKSKNKTLCNMPEDKYYGEIFEKLNNDYDEICISLKEKIKEWISEQY